MKAHLRDRLLYRLLKRLLDTWSSWNAAAVYVLIVPGLLFSQWTSELLAKLRLRGETATTGVLLLPALIFFFGAVRLILFHAHVREVLLTLVLSIYLPTCIAVCLYMQRLELRAHAANVRTRRFKTRDFRLARARMIREQRESEPSPSIEAVHSVAQDEKPPV